MEKTAVLLKQADLMDIFRKASESVCTSTIVVQPNNLSPTPTYLAMKTPENKEDKPMTQNHQMKETSKWKTPLISCTDQV